MYIHSQQPPPSPRAQELGLRLADWVRDYREKHPDLTPHDIEMGIAVARNLLELGSPARLRVFLIASALVAILGILGALYLFKGP